MFERFTDKAKKVMALANQEAQLLHHEYVGTEHLLLGLMKEGSGVGAIVLKSLGVDLKMLRQFVEARVKLGPDKMVIMERLPQTPRAKKVIEYAIEEARVLNSRYVNTEHLFLGLIYSSDSIAVDILSQDFKFSLDYMRGATLALLRLRASASEEPEEVARAVSTLSVKPAEREQTCEILRAGEITKKRIDEILKKNRIFMAISHRGKLIIICEKKV